MAKRKKPAIRPIFPKNMPKFYIVGDIAITQGPLFGPWKTTFVKPSQMAAYFDSNTEFCYVCGGRHTKGTVCK